MAIVDLGEAQYGVARGQVRRGADMVALVSTLRFLDAVLAMALTATRFRDMMDDILAVFKSGRCEWV